jgi:surface polysaccharide O-acyltransferase-like enzyme
MATFFVICVHTVSLAASEVGADHASFYVLEMFRFFFLSCNPLFVMVSGSLLLAVTTETPFTFYRKRFSKVLLPFLVYYMFYLCAKEGSIWLRPRFFDVLVKRILLGAPAEAPHFWLIYVLLWLYVFTPLLRFVIAHCPRKLFLACAVVLFVIHGIETYAPLFGFSSPFGWLVDSFVGAFLFGYILSTPLTDRTEKILIACGIASFFVSCISVYVVADYESYLFNTSPTMLLFASAIFLLAKRMFRNVNRESRLLLNLSNISYSVLLIHWGILHFVVKQILGVNVLSGGIIGGCILMIVLTSILSLIGAWVIDQTILKFLHWFFSCIYRMIVSLIK